MATTVAQLTIEEFKGLIEEVIEQKLTEWLSDFDDRAEIRESVRDRLLQQSHSYRRTRATLSRSRTATGISKLTDTIPKKG